MTDIIRYGIAGTPLGNWLIAQSAAGICRAVFDADEATEQVWLRQRFPSAVVQRDDALATTLTQGIFSGKAPVMPMDIATGTAFQQQVWQALLRIPYGQRITYGQLAEQLGKPGAARAGGNAVGANPIAVLVPCHRVVGQNGALGGYRWGVARKQQLLAHEAGAFRL